jgi:TonB family protein
MRNVASNAPKTMKTTIIILLTILSVAAVAQNKSGSEKTGSAIDTAKLLSCKMKYPPEARRKGIQGTVEIRVTFDSECAIVKREIVKSVGSGCDEEAMTALKNSEERIRRLKGTKCKDGEEQIYPFHFVLD